MPNYFTRIPTAAPLNSLTINNPLTELDNAITAARHAGGVDLGAPPYNAVGDGTDVTDAYETAVAVVSAAGRGTVYFPDGDFLIKRQVNIMRSHITIAGAGKGRTRLIFDPESSNHSVRFTAIHSGDNEANELGHPYDISGTIAIGDMGFEVVDANAGDNLSHGDWILVFSYHPNTAYGGVHGEIVEFDWMQVDSVSGTTINTTTPFRETFGTYGGWTFFQKMINLVENVTMRDFTLVNLPHPDGYRTLGITVSAAKDTTLQNLDIISEPGPNFSTYRAKGTRILNCNFKSINASSSEISVAVDTLIEGCTFAGEWADEAIDYTPLLLSFGCGFFRLVDNTFINGAGAMLSVLYGVHDGIIANNVFGYAAEKSGGSTGILLRGVQRLMIASNVFRGGGGTGYAINLGHEFPASGPNIYSVGNYIGPNYGDNFGTGKYALGINPPAATIFESKGHSGYEGSDSNHTTAAVTTTDNTITTLYQQYIHTNVSAQFDIRITARRTDSNGRGFYWRRSCVWRGSSGAITIAATDTPAADHESSITGTITIDNSGEIFRVRVTGETAKTICWVAEISWHAATAVDA